ncbi:unnamed protein product [Euphydryas editha]|nr:unnamed protein product [Euphydryas editha]
MKVYASTEKATYDEINSFYETLRIAQRQARESVFVISDFNTKIGKPKIEDKENFVLRKFGYGDRNGKGEKLIQYALEHKLAIMKKKIKIRKNRKRIWLSPCGNIKNEIDFILSKYPTKIRNVEWNGMNIALDSDRIID